MTKKLQIDVPEYITVVRCEKLIDSVGCYIAFHRELPNTIGQGYTAREAEENLVEATELTLAHLKANNLPIPKPMSWEDAFFIFSQDENVIPFEKSLISPHELTEDEIEYGKELESLALEYLNSA